MMKISERDIASVRHGAGASWLIYPLLACVTFAVYCQVGGFDFVNYDDNLYVTDNAHVKAGLTMEGIRWAFTTGHASNWHPLTWLSFMTDVSLFGASAPAFHIENVIFHIVNSSLLLLLLRRMTGALWPSAFAAAIFALHPLHVESVAWIAERKDVISAFFWITTMLAYETYARRDSIVAFFAALILFGLGLMTKPMLVTLPAVLMLMDAWPLGRMKVGDGVLRRFILLVLEKTPFIIFAAASCVVTFLVQQRGDSIAAVDILPIGSRIANAITAYASYIVMTVRPINLAVFYPHPGTALPMWKIASSAIFLMALTVPIIMSRRSRPYLLIGWLWFLGTLIPVIGLVQAGAQSMADRYMYIPQIGLAIIAAWGGRDVWAFMGKTLRKDRQPGLVFFAAPAFLILAIFAVITAVQISYWKDSVALFSHAINVTSGNYLAHKNLGVAYSKHKQYDQAIKQYLDGIKAKSNDPDLYYNLGNTMDDLGKLDEAEQQFRKALHVDPKHCEAHYNLANVLARRAKFDDALAEYDALLKINPKHLGGLINLGNTFAMLHRPANALPCYEAALKIDPGNQEALTNTGNALVELGKHEDAIRSYEKSVQYNPKNIGAYANMGFAYMKMGRMDDAAKAYSEVLKIDPSNAAAQQALRALKK
jgi:tetratricopeptide (TPR) repeat protein